MAKKHGKIIEFAEFREQHGADHEQSLSDEESDANSCLKTSIHKPRHRGQSGHWTFKGWTTPSPFLTKMMRAPMTAPPLMHGTAMLESGALAYRRLKNGKPLILLVSKKRSKKWGIPKGKLNASLSFGETAAKEAFEEAGVMGRVSPNSIGMFRAKKELPPQKILKCGFICLRWMRRFRIGPRKKNARRDGYHVRLLPESFVSRYSRIFVAALRRVKSAPICRRRTLFRGERARPKHS
jgi:ADP-ribose pyrophosphatase YjhB (NUDIX family)